MDALNMTNVYIPKGIEQQIRM